MSVILFTWELGGGLGHLVQIAPIALGLARAGHRVFLALRDLASAHTVFPPEAIPPGKLSLLPAPFKHRTASPGYKPPVTFPHLLHNCGFNHDPELASLLAAWQQLYDFVRPDLIIFDHSPSALLASRALPKVRRALIGSGFCVPPDEYPMRNLRPWIKAPPDALLADESKVLQRVNRLLDARKLPPLERLGQLYGQVDETFLTTFPELDHFAGRKNTRYWGPVTRAAGRPALFPDGEGKHIYAYLKPFPALPQLLQFLNDRKLPTLIYADGVARDVQQRFSSPTLRFENQPVDLADAARQCDLAIINGNHGTTATMLMAGKPMLQLPIVLEQGLMARNIRRLGVGLDASTRKPDQLAERLQSLLDSPAYAQTAAKVADRYKSFNPASQSRALVERTLQLLPHPSPFR